MDYRCLLVLSFLLLAGHTESEILSRLRQRRAIIYPTGTVMQFSVGLAIPAEVPNMNIATNMGVLLNVPMPDNATKLFPYIIHRPGTSTLAPTSTTSTPTSVSTAITPVTTPSTTTTSTVTIVLLAQSDSQTSTLNNTPPISFNQTSLPTAALMSFNDEISSNNDQLASNNNQSSSNNNQSNKEGSPTRPTSAMTSSNNNQLSSNNNQPSFNKNQSSSNNNQSNNEESSTRPNTTVMTSNNKSSLNSTARHGSLDLTIDEDQEPVQDFGDQQNSIVNQGNSKAGINNPNVWPNQRPYEMGIQSMLLYHDHVYEYIEHYFHKKNIMEACSIVKVCQILSALHENQFSRSLIQVFLKPRYLQDANSAQRRLNRLVKNVHYLIRKCHRNSRDSEEMGRNCARMIADLT
ncbi:hypothetical protein M8J76_004468 [Diaphorina citri]|nr:hypothetical protein M8J76_004468 [Diaphorina citri]